MTILLRWPVAFATQLMGSETILTKRQIKLLLQRLLLAVLIIISYKVISNISSVLNWFSGVLRVLLPFIYGFVIAYLLNIPCSALEKRFLRVSSPWVRKKARGLSVLAVYLVSLAAVGLLLNIVIPSLRQGLTHFIANFPQYYANAVNFIQQLPLEELGFVDDWVNQLLKELSWKDLIERIGVNNLLNSLNFVMGLTSYVINIFIAIISSIYFLLEAKSFKAHILHLLELFLPNQTHLTVRRYVRILDESFNKFIVCQLTDSLIIGVLTTIEFALMGSRYAVVLGVMLAVCNIIPYFGSIVGSVVASVIMAITGGLGAGVLAAVVLLITQQIDGNIVQPKIMGDSFSLSPVLIIVGITLGGAAGGIWGMILAIPLVNVLKYLEEEAIRYKEASLAAQAANSDPDIEIP